MSLVPFVHLDATLQGASAGDHLPLSDDDRHHLARVLRLRDGAPVEVADGGGRSAAGVLEGEHVRLDADPRVRARSGPLLEVAQALPKGRKFDEVVRQLTELDVDAIVPLDAERCVARVEGPRAQRAEQRWNAVARAACEQARRSDRPAIGSVTSVRVLAAQAAARDGAVVLVAHPGGDPLGWSVEPCRSAGRVTLVIGPEGGLSSAELALLEGAGGHLVGLGASVLRTEHAGAAALAALSYALGRWD